MSMTGVVDQDGPVDRGQVDQTSSREQQRLDSSALQREMPARSWASAEMTTSAP